MPLKLTDWVRFPVESHGQLEKWYLRSAQLRVASITIVSALPSAHNKRR